MQSQSGEIDTSIGCVGGPGCVVGPDVYFFGDPSRLYVPESHSLTLILVSVLTLLS